MNDSVGGGGLVSAGDWSVCVRRVCACVFPKVLAEGSTGCREGQRSLSQIKYSIPGFPSSLPPGLLNYRFRRAYVFLHACVCVCVLRQPRGSLPALRGKDPSRKHLTRLTLVYGKGRHAPSDITPTHHLQSVKTSSSKHRRLQDDKQSTERLTEKL